MFIPKPLLIKLVIEKIIENIFSLSVFDFCGLVCVNVFIWNYLNSLLIFSFFVWVFSDCSWDNLFFFWDVVVYFICRNVFFGFDLECWSECTRVNPDWWEYVFVSCLWQLLYDLVLSFCRFRNAEFNHVESCFYELIGLCVDISWMFVSTTDDQCCYLFALSSFVRIAVCSVTHLV